MKKLVGIFLVGIIAVAAMSCGGPSTPSDIQKAIYKQFQKGNYEEGVTVFFDNSTGTDTENRSEGIKAFAQKAKEGLEKKGGIKDFEIMEEKIDETGEAAVVTSKIIYGDGSEKQEKSKYKKVDGKWKIDLSTGK